MLWKDVIELGQQTETEIYHEIIKSWTYRQVFANKKSVRQSESYQAASIGMQPELMFEVNTIDFDNEERLKFNDKVYEITRIYDTGEVTELVVTAHTGSDV